jgi:multiple sugar transport system permease protein
MRAGRLAVPYLTGLVLLVALPAAAALGLSLYEFSGIGPARFAAGENFGRLFSDPALWRSFGNTLVYVAISVPVRVAAAIGLALLMYRRSRGVGGARAAVYLPTIIPDVAYALLWLWLLNPLYGPIPAAIRSVGIDSPGWLTQPWGARISVPLMSAFQIGEGFVIALAARRLIPPRLYEAAAVDGATPWFAMTRITFPLMAPVVALLALRDLILALQVNFVPALILTGGGPRYATTYLAIYTYQQGFGFFRLGYASAISVTMFAITALVVYTQYRLARRWRLV